MKKNKPGKAAINNKPEEKQPVTFFAKSGSPKNFRETVKLVMNLVVNLFG